MGTRWTRWGDDQYGGSALLVLLGAAVLAASTGLSWVSASAGSRELDYSLLEVPVVPVAFALGVVAIGIGAVAALRGDSRGLELAAGAAATLALVTAFFVVFAETIAGLIPGSGAAVSVGSLSIGAGVGPGAWLALAAAIGILVAAIAPARERALASAESLRQRGTVGVAAFATLVAAVVAIAVLRQETWAVAELLGLSVSVSAVAAPVLSIATYLAAWVLAAAVALLAFGLFEAGALLAVLAGWIVNAAAGSTIVAASTVAQIDAAGAHATAAAWLAFLAGGLVAAAACVLVWQGREAR